MSIMSKSILANIKKLLNIDREDTSFDPDVIMNINGTFLTLQQLGIGPKKGFSISDYNEVWSDFSTDQTLIDAVVMYVYLKARMTFDVPASSVVADQFNSRIAELEWRLNIQAEREETEEDKPPAYRIKGTKLFVHDPTFFATPQSSEKPTEPIVYPDEEQSYTIDEENETLDLRPIEPTYPPQPSIPEKPPAPPPKPPKPPKPPEPPPRHPDPFEDGPRDNSSSKPKINEDGPDYNINGETMVLFRNIFG